MSRSGRGDFLRQLPRKSGAAGVLILKDKSLLAFVPSYRSSYLIPGGAIEANESPYEALMRECQEKMGTQIQVESFLCVDYKRGTPEVGDAINFLFYGRLHGDPEIKTQGIEIKKVVYVPLEEIRFYFEENVQFQILAGLKALVNQCAYYCEDGKIRFPISLRTSIQGDLSDYFPSQKS